MSDTNMEVLVINGVNHDAALYAALIVVLSCFALYQIIRIILTARKRKKIYAAAGLIIDGHDGLVAGRKVITVNGEALSSELVKNEIEKNEKKINEIRKKNHPEQADADKADEKAARVAKATKASGNGSREAEKKEKAPRKPQKAKEAASPETVLNSIYEEDDIFYDSIRAYYGTGIPTITDPIVREKVLKSTSRKKDGNRRMEASDMEGYGVFD